MQDAVEDPTKSRMTKFLLRGPCAARRMGGKTEAVQWN